MADAGRTMVEIVSAAQERLSVLMNEAGSSRDMQVRRDAWTFYQRVKTAWREGTLTGWQKALQPAATATFTKSGLDGIVELLLAYIADAAGWTEHGGSVGGAWLTDGGREALANLRTPEYA